MRNTKGKRKRKKKKSQFRKWCQCRRYQTKKHQWPFSEPPV